MANLTAAAQYAQLIQQAADDNGLAPALLAGLIDHESRWDPRAIRQEVRIHDASRGLGQLLLATAQEYGFNGAPEDLFDPAVNIPLTAKVLAARIDQAGGSVQGGVSAYNGGYRPQRGFGAPATSPLIVVLARSQTTGEPVTTRQVPVGQYANQPYVDSVMTAARAFTGASSPFADDAIASATRVPSPAPVSDVINPQPRSAPEAPGDAETGSGGKAALMIAGGLLAAYSLYRAYT